MTFYIEFKDSTIGKVDPLNIGSFSFLYGIFNVYTGAKLLLKDFARKYNNVVETGTEIDVHFIDESDSSKDSVVQMSVLSFKKVPGPSITDYMDLTLVSRSYFYNNIGKVAHVGTVSEIINKIYLDKFKDYYSGLELDNTSDKERIRYQLSERDMDFMDRITKYGYIKNLPVYLYGDAFGKLNLRGISNMETTSPKYLITPLISKQFYQKSSADSTTIPLVAIDYQFYGINKESVSEYSSIFNTSLFVSSGSYDTSHVYSNSENGNAQNYRVSPSKVEFYNWNLSPEDALGVSARKSFERSSSTNVVDVTFNSFLIQEMQLGSTVYLLLPYEPTARSSNGSEVNSGEGKYVVSQVRLLYEKNQLLTQVRLRQSGY